VHYRFEKRYWLTLKTTNPIERVNKEFKRRAKAMGTMGESTRECLLAFTALRLEMGWKQVPVDHIQVENIRQLKDKYNPIEEAMTTLLN
jgi:putative transposase